MIGNFGLRRSTYDTHALPSSEESSNADHEADGRKYSPATASVTEGDKYRCYDASNNTRNTEPSSKDYTRSIAIADRPADEVGMRLATKSPFDGVGNVAKGGRVGGVSESVKEGSSLLRREVELARCAVCQIDCDDA